MDVVIEAVNTFENGPYLLYTTAQAAEFVQSVRRGGTENVKLQYDVFHARRVEGNLVAILREHFGQRRRWVPTA